MKGEKILKIELPTFSILSDKVILKTSSSLYNALYFLEKLFE